MKKLICLQVFILLFVFTASAQNKKGMRKGKPSAERLAEIQSQRVAFFSSELELTPAEAEKFWPLYNEYVGKKMELEKNKRQLVKVNVDSLDNVQASKNVDNYIQSEMDKVNLLKSYSSKFKEIISSQKILKMYKAEHQFSREIIRMIKKGNEPPAPGLNFPPDAK